MPNGLITRQIDVFVDYNKIIDQNNKPMLIQN